MSKNKHYSSLVEFLLGDGGYTYDRTNSHGYEVYKNKDLSYHRLGIVKISVRIAERDARNFIYNICRELGMETPTDANKRKAQQVKERSAVDRDRVKADIERGKSELAALVAKRDEEYAYRIQLRDERNRQLDGAAKHLTSAEVTSIERHIREKEQAILEWQKLLAMPTSPTGKNWYVA